MERDQVRTTIEQCYAARMSGDKETLGRLCAPDAQFEVVGARHLIDAYPAAGPMNMAPALDEIMSLVKMTGATPVTVLIDGNRAAVQLRATVAFADRQPFETELCHLWEFDEGGKVKSVLEFLDTAMLAGEMAALQ
jgi:ketosteroid isomerase-like protein